MDNFKKIQDSYADLRLAHEAENKVEALYKMGKLVKSISTYLADYNLTINDLDPRNAKCTDTKGRIRPTWELIDLVPRDLWIHGVYGRLEVWKANNYWQVLDHNKIIIAHGSAIEMVCWLNINNIEKI